jgi:hypothetical protein
MTLAERINLRLQRSRNPAADNARNTLFSPPPLPPTPTQTAPAGAARHTPATMQLLPGIPVLRSPPAAATGAGRPAARGQETVRPPRTRRATSAIQGQYFSHRSEVETAALERILGARREAAELEKALHVETLRAVKEEAVSKKEILESKKKKEAEELEIVKIKKAKIQAEFVTAELQKHLAIAKYNQVMGSNLALPPLPPM